MEEKAVQQLAIERLVCRPQVRERFDEESLAGLAQTIKETGILQPLLVRRDGSEFVVLEGERRLRAAKIVGLTHVPVIIDDRELSAAEVVQRQYVANCSREELRPLEKAEAIRQYMEETGCQLSVAAFKFGEKPSTATKFLALLSLPEVVQEQVKRGALSYTTAYALSLAPDAESQLELASQAANGGLRREDVIRRARERKTRKNAGTVRKSDRQKGSLVLLAVGERCHVKAPGRGVTVEALAGRMSEFLNRLLALEPKDMELADAAKALASS